GGSWFTNLFSYYICWINKLQIKPMIRLIYCMVLTIALLFSACGKDTPTPEGNEIDKVKGWLEYSLLAKDDVLLMAALISNESDEALTVEKIEVYYKSALLADFPPHIPEIPAHTAEHKVGGINGMPELGYDFDVKVYFKMKGENYVMSISNKSFKTERL